MNDYLKKKKKIFGISGQMVEALFLQGLNEAHDVVYD